MKARKSRTTIFHVIRQGTAEEPVDRERLFDAVQGMVRQSNKDCLSCIEDETGLTPLHAAIACKYEPLIELLVAEGARLDAVSTRLGQTPLHWLPVFGISARCVRVLLAGQTMQYISRTLALRDNNGATALDIAVSLGDWGLARVFMTYDAHPDHGCFRLAQAQGQKGRLLWVSMASMVSKSRKVVPPTAPSSITVAETATTSTPLRPDTVASSSFRSTGSLLRV